LAEGQRSTLMIPVQAQGGLGQGKVHVRVTGLQLPNEPTGAFEREWTLGVRPAYPAMLKHYRVALKDQPWTLPEADLAAFEPAGL
ncbi:hypothetical protein QVM81_24615, partial [Enterobacter rongchengensis]